MNATLANDIGNLLNRTLNLLKKNCDSATVIASSDIPADHPLRLAAGEKVFPTPNFPPVSPFPFYQCILSSRVPRPRYQLEC